MNVDRIALAIGEAADVELVEACECAIAIRGRLREIVDVVIPIAIIEDDEVSICVRTKVNGVVACAAVDGIRACPCKDNVIARASRDAIRARTSIHRFSRKDAFAAGELVVLARQDKVLDLDKVGDGAACACRNLASFKACYVYGNARCRDVRGVDGVIIGARFATVDRVQTVVVVQ